MVEFLIALGFIIILFATIIAAVFVVDSYLDKHKSGCRNIHIELWKTLDTKYNINFIGKLIVSILVFPFTIGGTILGYASILVIVVSIAIVDMFVKIFQKEN